MNKLFSVLMISTALFITAGCGNKKQTKAIVPTTSTVVEADATTDSKEDYAIVA